MKQNVLYVENPSDKLLNFIREMKDKKEESRLELLSKKDMYLKKDS